MTQIVKIMLVCWAWLKLIATLMMVDFIAHHVCFNVMGYESVRECQMNESFTDYQDPWYGITNVVKPSILALEQLTQEAPWDVD